MAINDAYAKSSTGVADGGDMIVDGSASGTGSVQITEMSGTGACNILREVDTAADGTWATSIQIDSTSGTWHSQLNEILVSQSQNTRLRLVNASGGTVDVFVAGFEVDN